MGMYRRNLNTRQRKNSRKHRLAKAETLIDAAIKEKASKDPAHAVLPDGTKIMDTGMPGLTSPEFVDKSE
jgi:hypothetical protein